MWPSCIAQHGFSFLCDTNRTGSGRCVANGQTRFRRGNMTNRASATSPLYEGVESFMLSLLLIIVGTVCEVFRGDACMVSSQHDDLLTTGEQGIQLEQQAQWSLNFWPSGFL